MSALSVHAADLFCGAGGTSTGLAQACVRLGVDLQLLAINHWQVAIDTHSANHPAVNHLCESLDNVNPRHLVPSGRLQLLVASPECTHHANARGGRPMCEQSRASAWVILRWAEALYIENLLIENVREFRTWGPLGANGRPIKRLRGQLYIQFLNSLKALGYNVEDRVLNAADYGDPTTRERLFVIARRGGKPIMWPVPTHAPASRKTGFLSTQLEPWRTARQIIDWKLQGKSIFTRKRPLAQKTLNRIIAGLERFGGPNAEPFLVVLRNHGVARSIDKPVPALCANGNHVGVCEPFVLGQQSGAVARSVDQPLPTVAGKGAIAVVDPFLVAVNHGEDKTPKGGNGRRTRSVDQPMPTVTTKRNMGLVEPFIIGHPRGNDGEDKTAVDSVDKPLRTVTAQSCDMALVEPFILPQFGESKARSVDRPVGSLTTTSRGVALVEPFLLNIDHHGGNSQQVRGLDNPVPTQTSKARTCLVEPFITSYHGSHAGREDGAARVQGVEEPLPTLDTSNRFGLVEPFIVPQFGERDGQDPRTHSLDVPLPAVTGHGAGALVEPFITKYNGTAKAQSVDDPLDTVTGKDRFALVETAQGQFYVDIRFRMLQPHELARAQGFPDSYEFKGTREDVVKQIGNAVPVNLATALCESLLLDKKRKGR